MNKIFVKEEIIKASQSPYENYSVGYPMTGNYLTALVIDIGSSRKRFNHDGSEWLDGIIAYDKAEASDTYIGQINMITVSSFCGPHGLIWGYDIAKEDSQDISSLISQDKLKEFDGVTIRNGKNLRMAANSLFGTLNEKHFPFLPGSHVPCAGKYYTKAGPALLYGAIAIGIPENREDSACVLMEDPGEIILRGDETKESIEEQIILNNIRSVVEIGKIQNIKYKEIFIDFYSKNIDKDEVGCVLVAMPYFHLAKKAFCEELSSCTLDEWKLKTLPQFKK